MHGALTHGAPTHGAPTHGAMPAGDDLVWSGGDLLGVEGEVGGCVTMHQLNGATTSSPTSNP